MNTLLALGANLPSSWGNPAETLSKAIGLLSERIGAHVEIGHFYVAPAYPAGSGPDFVNTAIALSSKRAATELLEICHRIEKEAARDRTNRWAPRTLDIDLIACGDRVLPNVTGFNAWATLAKDEQVVKTPDQLILPHPRMQDRAFVLIPLNDVAPDWIHPVFGQTTAQMLAALPDEARAGIERYESP